MRRIVPLSFLLVVVQACLASSDIRSKATMDSGAELSAHAAAYSIEHYVLRNDILVDAKAIAGSGAITFRARSALSILELDLDALLAIDGIEDAGGELSYTRDDGKIFVELRNELAEDATHTVTVHYHGKPRQAIRAPWDGGFVWDTSPNGTAWIATALQGEGCDLWWPCKDHPDGEPASMDLYFTVPSGLFAASNGVLIDVIENADTTTYHWQTAVPTNTYGVALNIGDFVLIEQDYPSTNGTIIPLKFWALREHEEKAREFFEREMVDTLDFFERRLGPYPWGEEKLGIVETPHYGMEHQTIIAYGRNYKRNTYGFDYILNHEMAHEWFGNLMTHSTPTDLWLHEGFGTFMQSAYSREHSGEAAYNALVYSEDKRIKACHPIAPRSYMTLQEIYFDVDGGSGPASDIYGKGAAVLRSLAYVIGEDAFWNSLRRLLYDTAEPWDLQPPMTARFRSTEDFIDIVNDEAGRDLGWFFEVYLRRGPLPEVAIHESGDDLVLTWQAVDSLDFPMPLPARVNGELRRIEFSDNQSVLTGVSRRDLVIDPLRDILRRTEDIPNCEERLAEAD